MPVGRIDWESMVRADYISGKIDVEQLEEEIGLLLAGGLPQRLLPGTTPFSQGGMVRQLR